MNDITEGLDLLGDWLDAKGYTEEAGLCTRAMDEINKLRGALAPFADLLERYGRFEQAAIDVAILYAAAATYKETQK